MCFCVHFHEIHGATVHLSATFLSHGTSHRATQRRAHGHPWNHTNTHIPSRHQTHTLCDTLRITHPHIYTHPRTVDTLNTCTRYPLSHRLPTHLYTHAHTQVYMHLANAQTHKKNQRTPPHTHSHTLTHAHIHIPMSFPSFHGSFQTILKNLFQTPLRS